jgi:hypothetical protein
MSLLRPGLHVVRRDDRHLQIGLDPPWRLVVPDEPDVRRLLDDLVAGRPPEPATGRAHRVLRDLAAAGMLDPATAPALGAVTVSGSADRVGEADRLLTAAGVRRGRAEDADVALVITDGEPARDVVDDHLRAGRPHLVVSSGPHDHRVGPFVAPGRTACLRCVDAHLGELDPRRAVVVEQLAGRPASPEEPVLAVLAVAWAVQDVLRYLSGDRPSTWSATVSLAIEGDPEPRSWARHPHCGCSWAHPFGTTDRAVSGG